MHSPGRPIGMTVLSLIAFAISAAFVILRGLFFYSIFLQHLPASLREDPQAFAYAGQDYLHCGPRSLETEGRGEKVSLHLDNSLCAAGDWLSSIFRSCVQHAGSGFLPLGRIFSNLSAEAHNLATVCRTTGRRATLKFSIARDKRCAYIRSCRSVF